jgi:membrane protein YdbS with pleckstrin-like domain
MFNLSHLPHAKRDEEIIFLLRRDHIILLRTIAWYLLLLLVPFFIRVLLVNYNPDFLLNEIRSVVLTLIAFGYYLFVWLFFYRAWLDYYLDVWVVTNHRILNIELQGLFNRVVAEQKLFRVQDVTTEQKGFLAHFFHYGNVHIQTAGTKERFVFEEVSQPNRVARQISQLVEWNKRAYPDEK